jgi:hypothetical protein
MQALAKFDVFLKCNIAYNFRTPHIAHMKGKHVERDCGMLELALVKF